jgi:hypothetical protein
MVTSDGVDMFKIGYEILLRVSAIPPVRFAVLLSFVNFHELAHVEWCSRICVDVLDFGVLLSCLIT